VRPEFAPGTVGRNLKRVGTGIASRGTFERLTPGQREAWKTVLTHNLYDCLGLREVVMTAAADLAATTDLLV
jgi:hypothetical protein